MIVLYYFLSVPTVQGVGVWRATINQPQTERRAFKIVAEFFTTNPSTFQGEWFRTPGSALHVGWARRCRLHREL